MPSTTQELVEADLEELEAEIADASSGRVKTRWLKIWEMVANASIDILTEIAAAVILKAILGM